MQTGKLTNRLLWGAVGLTFGLTLGGLAFVADRALYYRTQWFATQELARPASFSLVQDKAELVTKNTSRWVIFGDSRVFRLPSPWRLGLELKDGVSFINKGERGITSVRATEIFEKEILPLHPSAAIAQIGINDVMFGSAEQALAATKTFVQTFVETSEKNGIKPILSTIIPLSTEFLFLNSRMLAWDESRFSTWRAAVSSINEWIRSYSASHGQTHGQTQGVGLVDYDLAFRDANHMVINSMYDGDGIHLSAEGQRLVLEKALASLEAAK